MKWSSSNACRLVSLIALTALYLGVITSYTWICEKHNCFGSFSPTFIPTFKPVDESSTISYNADLNVNNSYSVKDSQIRIHFFNPPPWTGSDTFKKCAHKCSISFGRNYKDYSSSKFVIFDGSNTLPKTPPPKPAGQVWIYHGMEPPFLQANLQNWNRMINWTFSYRRDAEFTHVYGTMLFKEVKDTVRVRLKSKWEDKSGGNAWFVSHKNVPSKRAKFAKALSNTTNVDIFSRTGPKKCPTDTIKDCNKLLSDKYKFYLAFENELCRDYVTEKCFKIYASQADVIPVVRGAPDYSLFAPPHSYIDTSEFNDISSLGTFQLKLGNNRTAFEDYFQWRKYYYNEPTGDRAFCQLCAQAHRVPLRYRLYDNLKIWIHGDSDNPMCRQVSDIK
ncbi:alpha-(1,3)-fucosyltransferase C-like isoform X2 [Ylistrum balloti]|uniref:alpha-(1,3)-fucosyltransferase C-like isoform X2 n=1 Tax=Ylistrum balloti TaxID=509963 RepID=UPI002905A510|nr:alpha-(1,3)-fucosyltransferase C-like isoform X2 [Ylistrum balloti]